MTVWRKVLVFLADHDDGGAILWLLFVVGFALLFKFWHR